MTEVKDPIIVAVELGTSRISGIAGKRKDGSFQILAYAEEQTTACLKRGIVYNVEKTTQSIKKEGRISLLPCAPATCPTPQRELLSALRWTFSPLSMYMHV